MIKTNRLFRKAVRNAAVLVIVELTGHTLDRLGWTEQEAHIKRAITKAAAATGTGLLIDAILGDSAD